jgi:hypothetical protein
MNADTDPNAESRIQDISTTAEGPALRLQTMWRRFVFAIVSAQARKHLRKPMQREVMTMSIISDRDKSSAPSLRDERALPIELMLRRP